jgi:hypothetical protein
LKKTKIENARPHFLASRVPETRLRIMVTFIENTNKRMVYPDGLEEVKGEHLLGQQVDRI